MKTKIIFLLLVVANQLLAINSNGFVANINGFNFPENKNHEINSNYLQAISAISCGDGGSDEVTTILQNVDLKAGKFTCLKYLPGQTEPEKIEFKVDSSRLSSEKSNLKNFIDNNLGNAGVVFYNQLGSYVFLFNMAFYFITDIFDADFAKIKNKSMDYYTSNDNLLMVVENEN